MENGSSSSKTTELGRLQNRLTDKESRIQELKNEIENVKLRLRNKTQELPAKQMEALKILNEEYNKLRAEYHSSSVPSGNSK